MRFNYAAALVDAIIDDIADRKGLGDEWDATEDDIKFEIRDEWIRMAMRLPQEEV